MSSTQPPDLCVAERGLLKLVDLLQQLRCIGRHGLYNPGDPPPLSGQLVEWLRSAEAQLGELRPVLDLVRDAAADARAVIAGGGTVEIGYREEPSAVAMIVRLCTEQVAMLQKHKQKIGEAPGELCDRAVTLLQEEFTGEQHINLDKLRVLCQAEFATARRILRQALPPLSSQPEHVETVPPEWQRDDWEDLEQMVRRLLRYMHNRDSADVNDVCEEVWEKPPADVSRSAINTAVSKANSFLNKREYPRLLSKVRGENVIRWE
jgi:hypothetical protein